jgi:NAD(P)-dependent dehydrogenase (short-subunit alcohol dehydrogenase family)
MQFSWQFPSLFSSLFSPPLFPAFLPLFRPFQGGTGKHPDQSVGSGNPQCKKTQSCVPVSTPTVDQETTEALPAPCSRLLPRPPYFQLSVEDAVRAEAEKVLIVGGGSGAGLALARDLLADGAEVTIVGRSADRLSNARRNLARTGRLRTIVADISREDQVERLFGECGALHHIVTTAADIRGAFQSLSSLDIALARRIIDSRFMGPLLLAKHGVPCLLGRGSITLMSSSAARDVATRGPAAGRPVGAAINSALESLAQALSLELGPIRVNIVSPACCEAPSPQLAVPGNAKDPVPDDPARQAPIGRVGQAADVAEAIRFLIRNRSVTGTVLRVA